MTVSKLTLNISAELKTEFKIHCAQRGVSMTDVISDLLRKYMDQKDNKKGAM